MTGVGVAVVRVVAVLPGARVALQRPARRRLGPWMAGAGAAVARVVVVSGHSCVLPGGVALRRARRRLGPSTTRMSPHLAQLACLRLLAVVGSSGGCWLPAGSDRR